MPQGVTTGSDGYRHPEGIAAGVSGGHVFGAVDAEGVRREVDAEQVAQVVACVLDHHLSPPDGIQVTDKVSNSRSSGAAIERFATQSS